MFELAKIIDKKVTAIKGYKVVKYGHKFVEPRFILFDDKKTYLTLTDQDYFSFHDCAESAKHITLYEDKETWKSIMDNYSDATEDF